MSIKEKLESLGRNSIQLKIVGKETHKLGATRFGGKPDVPPDFVWPTYEGESYDHVVKDRPLTFLAQFNCAEPVSYTHLDVYKRQALHRGGAEQKSGAG